MSWWQLKCAASVLQRGGIAAYPTEAVYGLGCDPDNSLALERLLAVKGRDAAKGFILIASSLVQLEPYIEPFDETLSERVAATWPGPVTWLVPVRGDVSPLLSGGRDTLAVRVTAHPLAAALCDAYGGALVSTSANLSGVPPARSALAVQRMLGGRIDFILHGDVGTLRRPTEIRDARSGAIVRPAS
ncbi:MAG: tRNA threonylcarbamoyladenosine biosynthesis protein RimN [Thiotrichales bacterium SG8_50]|nr:MAG: tRNA threonylcarbamoyladenosine biosynthesis protein RimN [Thiotrichales bacterium SG8_50]